MKPIKFKESDVVYAENQPEYVPLPAFVGNIKTNPRGEVIFCMALSFKERVKLLFTGKLWCSLLMFRDPDKGSIRPLTPSFFTVNKKDVLMTIKKPKDKPSSDGKKNSDNITE